MDTAWDVVRDNTGRGRGENIDMSGSGVGSEGGTNLEVLLVERPKSKIFSVLLRVINTFSRDRSPCERPNECR